jgi:hypothetical protein
MAKAKIRVRALCLDCRWDGDSSLILSPDHVLDFRIRSFDDDETFQVRALILETERREMPRCLRRGHCDFDGEIEVTEASSERMPVISPDVLKLIVPKGGRGSATTYLKNWLHDAKELIIADPFLFSHRPSKDFPDVDSYADALFDLFPGSMTSLDVFHLPGAQGPVREAIQLRADQRKIRLRRVETTELHDRVWIRDNCHALGVGTSFNGLGNKIAFINKLPDEDLKDFNSELSRFSKAGYIVLELSK